MTGLDKILRQIKSESDAVAAAALSKAQAQADELAEAARSQAQAECDAILQRGKAQAEDLLARAHSAAELQKRKAVLAQKQQLIAQTLDKAKQSLLALPDAQYFAVILKMAQKFALPQEGEIAFSHQDLARLPDGFENTLNNALKASGAKLVVSKEPCRIDGGFVLCYGGVEENCSFTALFDSAHEALQDKVHEILFS